MFLIVSYFSFSIYECIKTFQSGGGENPKDIDNKFNYNISTKQKGNNKKSRNKNTARLCYSQHEDEDATTNFYFCLSFHKVLKKFTITG